SIPEIFERDGEAFFRQKETQIIARLMQLAPGILSTGGGAFLQPETRAAIAGGGVSVWLKADIELLWQRVRHKDTRPLLRVADPRARLEELLHAREPHYAQADIVVTAVPQFSIEEMAGAVMEALSQRPDALVRLNA
ncbi:MAG: shikimate kinase, partial [Pseudomonadota bacterium]